MRWSIRGLLITFVLVGLALTIPRWKSFQRHYAAQKLSRRGIDVVLADRSESQLFLWRIICGDDTYEWVEAIRVEERSLSDSDIQRLGAFPRLKTLLLYKCPTADAVLARLGGIQSLELLHIEASPVSSKGIRCLGNVSSIRHLRLVDLSLSDVDLPVFGGLPKLRILHMKNVNISDDGITALRSLGEMTHLTILDSPITGAGLGSLTDLPNLKFLNLEGCPITDVGLEVIKQIKTLKHLRVNSDSVTQNAVRGLEQSLPDCVVVSQYYKEAGQ